MLKFIYCTSATSCSDGVKNEDETDTDCGGSHCPKCTVNKGCNKSSDCTSGVCTANICQGRFLRHTF